MEKCEFFNFDLLVNREGGEISAQHFYQDLISYILAQNGTRTQLIEKT